MERLGADILFRHLLYIWDGNSPTKGNHFFNQEMGRCLKQECLPALCRAIFKVGEVIVDAGMI